MRTPLIAIAAAATALSCPAAAQDAQLRQLLLSSAWCSFSYNKVTGASRSERAQFSPNGTMTLGSDAQSYSSGAYGSVAGQSAGSALYYWRVEGGELLFSEDRLNWEPIQLDVRRNANGSFILVADGKEYAQCR